MSMPSSRLRAIQTIHVLVVVCVRRVRSCGVQSTRPDRSCPAPTRSPRQGCPLPPAGLRESCFKFLSRTCESNDSFQAAREEILKALTRHMTLSSDVSIAQVAAQCEHFTGADFKALLYNAQLKTIHRLLPSRSSRGLTSDSNHNDRSGGSESIRTATRVTSRAKTSESDNSTDSWENLDNGKWLFTSVFD